MNVLFFHLANKRASFSFVAGIFKVGAFGIRKKKQKNRDHVKVKNAPHNDSVLYVYRYHSSKLCAQFPLLYNILYIYISALQYLIQKKRNR